MLLLKSSVLLLIRIIITHDCLLSKSYEGIISLISTSICNLLIFTKLFIITGDFFLHSDSQISKEEKDWLYPQMIKAINKVKDSIIVVFSPIKLPGIMNYNRFK
jgi:hypothetical protein